jgi:hypothetical protein
MVYWRLPFILAREEALGQVSKLDVWWILRALINCECRALIKRLCGTYGCEALINHTIMQYLN